MSIIQKYTEACNIVNKNRINISQEPGESDDDF